MNALELALTAQRCGARFTSDKNGEVQLANADALPGELRIQLARRWPDVVAIVREFSQPGTIGLAEVLDVAQRMVGAMGMARNASPRIAQALDITGQ